MGVCVCALLACALCSEWGSEPLCHSLYMRVETFPCPQSTLGTLCSWLCAPGAWLPSTASPLSFQPSALPLTRCAGQPLGKVCSSGDGSPVSCWHIGLITCLKASSCLSVASGSCSASETPHPVSTSSTDPSLAAGLPGSCGSCSGADGGCALPGNCWASTRGAAKDLGA